MKQQSISTLAVVSLVLGIATFILFLGPLGAIPAVICGHLALSSIKRSEGTLPGKGLAVAGVTLGYIGTVVSLLVIGSLVTAGYVAEQQRKRIADIVNTMDAEANERVPQENNSSEAGQ